MVVHVILFNSSIFYIARGMSIHSALYKYSLIRNGDVRTDALLELEQSAYGGR